MVAKPGSTGSKASERYTDNKLKQDIRTSNMGAAKKLADAIRTSLGPRGMDKMLVSGNNDVTITNDGATILNKMEVAHPAAKMLVELSKSQDIVAGDGTTSVTVLCGSLLNKCIGLLNRGVHPLSSPSAPAPQGRCHSPLAGRLPHVQEGFCVRAPP